MILPHTPQEPRQHSVEALSVGTQTLGLKAAQALQRSGFGLVSLLIMRGQNQAPGLPTCTLKHAPVIVGSGDHLISLPACGFALTEQLVDNRGDGLWIERGFAADNCSGPCAKPRDLLCTTQLRRALLQQAPAPLWISVGKSLSFHHLSTIFQGQSTAA